MFMVGFTWDFGGCFPRFVLGFLGWDMKSLKEVVLEDGCFAAV
jgi:hypothetical protein